MNKILTLVLLSFFFMGCKYAPFVKYYRLDKETNLPKFNKYSYLAGSNNSLRTAYDVTIYDWHVKVDPEKKAIQGNMEIWMDIKEEQDSLLFDLYSGLKLDSVVCSKSLRYKRKRNLLYLIFPENLESDSQLEVTFYYHGKPPNILNEGPIVWKEDGNGIPWFSTQTEGLGVGYLFPCKDLLIDEPDKCYISVDVPEGMVTCANGKLQREVTENGRNITEWKVDNSINIYNISFNAGDFVSFTLPYSSVNGNDYDLEFYVLRENEDAARKFYAQTPEILRNAEELFGVYPWWNDGLKFVESTFSAMEHQGCIAMGSYYQLDWEEINTTLAHEIAHEWWGNSLTASDYSDIWLHEGLATYAENLVVERMYGYESYLNYCRNQMYWGIMNKRPIQKVPNVRYTSWANRADMDIYSKGAMLMHTLRTQLSDDELFFSILKDLQETYRDTQISSSEFEVFFLERTSKEFEVYFDVWLRQAEPPELAYSVFLDPENKKAELKFYWTNNVPDTFPMKVKFISGSEEIMLKPTKEVQSIELEYGVEYKMQPWVSGYFVSVPFGKK